MDPAEMAEDAPTDDATPAPSRSPDVYALDLMHMGKPGQSRCPRLHPPPGHDVRENVPFRTTRGVGSHGDWPRRSSTLVTPAPNRKG